MADAKACALDYFPDNVLVDILFYLDVRELVRAGRVCRRWRRLVKDQRLWRTVDLTTCKGVTAHRLWHVRHYLGCGLRFLSLRGLLFSARGGTFLSEPWLKALASKCPRLRRLSLLHTDLRGLRSCLLMPPTLQVLELHGCEVRPGFFTQSPSETNAEAASGSAGSRGSKDKAVGVSQSRMNVETLVLDNVPSFTDDHLRSLASWQKLSRLELRDVIRVTAAGLRACATGEDGCSAALVRLRGLELGSSGRSGPRLQMASLGLGAGWAGLEELTLGGREVGPGLLCVSRLRDLQRLRLRCCSLSEMQVLRSCRALRSLRRLEFSEVDFQIHQRTPDREGGEDGDAAGDSGGKFNESDPVPTLRRSLATLLPQCVLVFVQCKVTISSD